MKEKKKHYEAPWMKAHQVKPESIICTSGNTEEYQTQNPGWTWR